VSSYAELTILGWVEEGNDRSRFRLKRSGGRWFIEGLGILRCAQDDGRNRQKQGKDEGINDGGAVWERTVVCRVRRNSGVRCGKERWYAGVRKNGGMRV
jgi:hypothetical protein